MLNQNVMDDVARGLMYGEYSLLLGAGASIGATGGNGRPLPTGVGLRDALMKEFEIEDEGDPLPLSQLYDYLQRTRREQIHEFLRAWFTKCSPNWQQMLAEFNWHRIWTLNIDDVVETAYAEVGRPLEVLAWHERFTDRASDSIEQIIHLHGFAGRLLGAPTNDNSLVFSLSDYAREVANPRTWHRVFFDEFSANPFLVIGAQLVEEIDLIEALMPGNAASDMTGFPSVVVVPSITPIRRDQLESSGFTIIESDGQSFVSALLERYRAIISENDKIFGPSTPGLRKFSQQFIDLRTFRPIDLDAGDFYSGYQPTWQTTLSDNDAILDATSKASDEIVKLAASEDVYQEFVFLTGNPGSGKSTGLLRIAANLRSHGMFPFLFRADEYIDVEAAVEWLKTVPRTVLLFDDFADHSSTIQRLADECKQNNIRMLLVGSDRSGRHPIIGDRIDPQYLNLDQAQWYGRLSDEDIERIIDKLHSRGRLGRITRWDRDEQRNYFVGHANRSLFDAMAELEGGSGFRETVKQIYQGLPSEGLRRLYAAACICYEQGIPIPTGIAANFADVAPKDFVALIRNACAGALVLTRVGIRPPHRITANLAVGTLPVEVRSDVCLSLSKVLAPHIDERAMRTGTREYRIVRYLMNQDLIARIAGENEGRKWYDELRSYYDWNGRYWDQRALFESRYGQHETARSYAERSIQVHRHSFGFNTLGTVLLRTAITRGSTGDLREGIKNLANAKNFAEWGSREHPFTTFFTSLIRYAEEHGIDRVPQEVKDDWLSWFREAQSSRVFSTRQSQDNLLNWQRQWLRFAAID